VSCTYSINPTSASYGSSGGSGSVSVTAQSGCVWTASSNAGWITVTSGSSGNGSGTVGYSVSANGSTSARSATITIAGRTFTVSQAGVSCTYSINPTSASYGSGGGSGSVSVTAQSGCAWTASSNAGWITVTSGSSGNGSGTVGYSVSANGSTSARSATITIAGRTFTVSQAGVSCTYSINPTSASYGSSGGSGSVSVTAQSGCAWTASSNAGWITVTSGSSGNGSGTVGYSVSANGSTSARSATITIADQIMTVTQAGTGSGGCAVDVIPSCPHSVNGALSTADCDDSPRGGGYYARKYEFEGADGTPVLIDATWTFDGYLFLVDPFGTVVASNDDYGTINASRIAYTPATTGTFTIWTTTFSPGVTGSFDLAITGCSGGMIFADGFDTGHLGQWSGSIGSHVGCPAVWRNVTTPVTYSLRAVASRGETVVAAGYGGILVSFDSGESWQEVTSGSYDGVLTFQGNFVASTTGNQLVSSADGVNWSQLSTVPFSYVGQVIEYGGGLLAVGADYVGGASPWRAKVATSSNGTDWTETDTGLNTNFTGVVAKNGTLVAVGYLDDVVATSGDGVAWTQTLSGFPLHTVTAVANRFVSSGYSDAVASDTGYGWTSSSPGSSRRKLASAVGNCGAAFVGDGTEIVWTEDGATWSVSTLPAGGFWGAATVGHRYVLVGNDGAILLND
jgi:hypothetical protein